MASILRRISQSVSSKLGAPVHRDPKHPRTLAHWGLMIVSTYCAGSLFMKYVISWSGSSGPSMYPTIPADSSVSIYTPLNGKGKGLRVGDIIHAKHPFFPRQYAGKRIIGMPGDYVLRDEHLSPTCGGAPLPPIVNDDNQRKEPVMVQVPEGHVWLAGDNMSTSRDSRFYGPVPIALVMGKTLYNGDGWFSWNSFRGDQLKKVKEGPQVESRPILANATDAVFGKSSD